MKNVFIVREAIDLENKYSERTIAMKYSDMLICDLRNIKSVEAAKEIEEINDVLLLLTPKNADSELMNAFAAIPKKDILMEYAVDMDAEVKTVNGSTEINDSLAGNDKETILIVNGMAILTKLSADKKLSLIVNGMLLINDNYADNVNVISVNGSTIHAKFDEYRFFGNKFTLDADMLAYIKSGTALVAGNKMKIKPDVTVDMLRDNAIILVAGNKIECSKTIAGYVKATAYVGNKVEVYDGDDEDDDGDGDE